jgi:hypothetical protein
MPKTDRAEYMREYIRRPEVKAKYNAISKAKSKEQKRKNTKKRIQEHTMEELIKIIKETCVEKNVNFESVKEQYVPFMEFLHNRE